MSVQAIDAVPTVKKIEIKGETTSDATIPPGANQPNTAIVIGAVKTCAPTDDEIPDAITGGAILKEILSNISFVQNIPANAAYDNWNES